MPICPSCKRNSHSRISCIRREIVASGSRRSSRDCRLYLHSPLAPLPQISVSPRSKGRASVLTRLDFTAYGVTCSPRRIGVVGPSRRKIVDVEQAKDEKPDVATKRPTRKLKQHLAARHR